MQESSMNFDMENVEPFLQMVSSLISSGFGGQEVAKVVAMAKQMGVDDERELEFRIQYDGKPAVLRVRVFMDDVDAPDLYFFSPESLAERIDAEMEKFCEELGI